MDRLTWAISEARKIDPSFSDSKLKTPYQWVEGRDGTESAPGLDLELRRPGQGEFGRRFSVSVQLETTGHERNVAEVWTAEQNPDLDPKRRYFWARERSEVVDLEQPGTASLWEYLYWRRQGNVIASIHGHEKLESPVILLRLVQIFEPAVDACLSSGMELPRVLTQHPVAEWPVAPLPPRSPAVRAEPIFQLSVFNDRPLKLTIFDPGGKVAWSCNTTAAECSDGLPGQVRRLGKLLLRPAEHGARATTLSRCWRIMI